MPKLFIESLPRNCTSKVLKNYFRKLTPSLRVRRSKNKGRKTKMWAIIDISSEEDFKRIVEMEHLILGQDLGVKPYVEKAKNPGKRRNQGEDQVVYEAKSKASKIQNQATLAVVGDAETKQSIERSDQEGRGANQAYSGKVNLDSLQLFCSIDEEIDQARSPAERQSRLGIGLGSEEKQRTTLFSLFPHAKEESQPEKPTRLLEILQPKGTRANDVPAFKPRSYGYGTPSISNGVNCRSEILNVSAKIVTRRHYGRNLRYNF